MKSRSKSKAAIVMALTLLLALPVVTTVAYAHERRDVAGDYQFVVGFIVEPPYEGQKNGVDLRVTRKAGNTPVTGTEATLKVEVTHVPTGVSRVFNLRTIFNDPGHYTADLIPTAPGHYRMRFFGAVEGKPVDETFNSRAGGGNFNDVQSSADLQFPEKLPEARELSAATRGALDTAQEAQASVQDAAGEASAARTLAIAGIALGAVGVVLGVGQAVLGRRNPRS
ncbi:MAG: hypothetical protein HY680_06620 [Chloroflexi bacterium]|nr:hypothetical protein [Chloroflexota bacterium]